jgi:hypothetical protein
MPAVQSRHRSGPAPRFPLSGPLGDSAGAHLSIPLTHFIARDQELAAVVMLLRDPGVHLLTLTGPGGVGKTRLASAAATDAGDALPDGVAFINLAPIAHPTIVLATIAGALGIARHGQRVVAGAPNWRSGGQTAAAGRCWS